MTLTCETVFDQVKHSPGPTIPIFHNSISILFLYKIRIPLEKNKRFQGTEYIQENPTSQLFAIRKSDVEEVFYQSKQRLASEGWLLYTRLNAELIVVVVIFIVSAELLFFKQTSDFEVCIRKIKEIISELIQNSLIP